MLDTVTSFKKPYYSSVFSWYYLILSIFLWCLNAITNWVSNFICVSHVRFCSLQELSAFYVLLCSSALAAFLNFAESVLFFWRQERWPADSGYFGYPAKQLHTQRTSIITAYNSTSYRVAFHPWDGVFTSCKDLLPDWRLFSMRPSATRYCHSDATIT